jgi:hypothetical protein
MRDLATRLGSRPLSLKNESDRAMQVSASSKRSYLFLPEMMNHDSLMCGLSWSSLQAPYSRPIEKSASTLA